MSAVALDFIDSVNVGYQLDRDWFFGLNIQPTFGVVIVHNPSERVNDS